MSTTQLILKLKTLDQKYTNVVKILKNLQLLKKAGKTNDEIMEVITSLKLPFSVHMFITGYFSDLITLKYDY